MAFWKSYQKTIVGSLFPKAIFQNFVKALKEKYFFWKIWNSKNRQYGKNTLTSEPTEIEQFQRYFLESSYVQDINEIVEKCKITFILFLFFQFLCSILQKNPRLGVRRCFFEISTVTGEKKKQFQNPNWYKVQRKFQNWP